MSEITLLFCITAVVYAVLSVYYQYKIERLHHDSTRLHILQKELQHIISSLENATKESNYIDSKIVIPLLKCLHLEGETVPQLETERGA
jgi:prefoldin subunit 5